MAAHPELTTDLESSDTAHDDAFWQSDPAGAPAQDWLGYLGLDDAEPLSTEFTAVPDPYASLAAPSDDLLPNR